MSHLVANGSVVVAQGATGQSVWVGIVTGILSFVVSRVLYDLYTTHQKRSRLTNALLVECAATLHRFDSIREAIRAPIRDEPKEIDEAAVRDLISGVVVSEPIDPAKELITLLRPKEAKQVVYFFDLWKTFIAQEKRYSELYKALLLDVCSERSCKGLAEEYWEQLHGILKDMNITVRDLSHTCCMLVRYFGPISDYDLADVCDNRWTSWKEWGEERNRYQPEE